MSNRKIIASLFILTALVLSFIFYGQLNLPSDPGDYFKKEYYNQLGPLTICVELLIAGIQLFTKNKNANFTLALFAFTAILDPVFNAVGLFSTNVPIYGSIVFLICALPALWIAFTNTYNLGKISLLSAVGSFVLGLVQELFFNYW